MVLLLPTFLDDPWKLLQEATLALAGAGKGNEQRVKLFVALAFVFHQNVEGTLKVLHEVSAAAVVPLSAICLQERFAGTEL